MLTKDAQSTIEAGIKFAQKLHGGEVLALNGDLGSGKTTFMKGLAEGLKVSETITSPTFVLLKEYAMRSQDDGQSGMMVHIDAYRVESLEDIKSVGIEDYLGRDDVIMAIEWADKIKEILPAKTIQLNFSTIDENTREITDDFDHKDD